MSVFNARQIGMQNWGTKELSDTKNIQLLDSLVQDFSGSLNMGDCNVLYLVLSELLAKKDIKLNQALTKKYQDFIKKFGILSLADRDEAERKQYFFKNLLFIFKNKLPIMALITSVITWRKWEYKEILQSFMDYMAASEELVGTNDSFNFYGKKGKPTVKNWIKDFVIFSGSPKELNSLNFIQYFRENANIKYLNKEEAKLLRKIVRLYTILSSPFKNSNYFQTPELFDTIFEPSEEVEEVAEEPKEMPSTDNLAKVNNIYKEKLVELQKKYNINQGLKDFQNQTLDELIKKIASNQKEAKVVLPALSLITNQDKTFSKLEKSKVVQNLIDPKLKKINVKEVFKQILTNAGLAEEESAVFVMYLAKANSKFIGMSYLDLKTLEFKWK